MDQAARHLQEKEQTVTRRRYQPEQETPVLPKRKVTKGEKMLWVLGGVMILFLSVFIISNQAHIFTTSRAIDNLENKVSDQTKINQQLQVEVTELNAPERIMAYAKKKLGLNLDIKNVKVLP